MMLSLSYPIVPVRSASLRKITFVFCQNPCTPNLSPTNQQRSFKSHTYGVYKAVYNQRKFIPERKDPEVEEHSYKKLIEALANRPKTDSPISNFISRFRIVRRFYKYWTAGRKPTGKTHFLGREFLGPHTPEVKRAREVVERLFLVLPDGHIFRRVEVVKNPGGTNASATWDGVIVIDQGIFHFAYNDNLLAYLIGHEMAHHLLQHDDKKSPGAKFYSRLVALQAFVTDMTSRQSPLFNYMMGTQMLENRKMSRDHEFEADEEGMMIMWRAGYNPKACMEFERKRVERDKQLERFEKNSDNKDKPALWTHPPHEQRLEHLIRCHTKRKGEVDRWWKENQLAVYDRKQRQDAEKQAREQLQKQKVTYQWKAPADVTRVPVSLGNSNRISNRKNETTPSTQFKGSKNKLKN
ncbi:hypothetical protein BOTCAL_0044g00360 [Botryotinia calthae]|uniref:Peptidase M48 domain-containing protein n=1 Tax=Botryotinia calthae TaxID=38488 RepID=A0A4Y8DC35_9HELO|nr:hypothetical protein BOTCAL_0044g00360 [Botryotinia calthae]